MGSPLQRPSTLPEPQQALLQIRAGERRALARALSCAESHHEQARRWLSELWALSGAPAQMAFRIAITGPAGAGKSSLIEALGPSLLSGAERLAVLPIDPSSKHSGGSLLADQTRMPRLSQSERVFIRPSASKHSLSGLAPHTSESVELCELAGYHWVIVESVGVGQNQTAAEAIADCVLLVLTPDAGDELQALKRGLNEGCDIVVINKADGPELQAAERLQRQYAGALQLLRRTPPPVLLLSAVHGLGLAELQRWLLERRQMWQADPQLQKQRRAQQRVAQFEQALEHGLLRYVLQSPQRQQLYDRLKAQVASGELPVQQALVGFAASLK